MDKLSLLVISIGLFALGGCAVQQADEGDDGTFQADEASQKKSSRADRIAACKADCDAKYTPCTGSSNPFSLATKGAVKPGCNSTLSPDLGANPFALAICKDACDKIP